ncbi:sulfate ABC transporter substrate-binding protein, partial [Kitasatospora sp. NPDC004745]
PAWADIDFLDDPLAGTLQAEADHAVTAGLLKKPNLNGIYDLTLLNKVLKEKGQSPVADAGLGAK